MIGFSSQNVLIGRVLGKINTHRRAVSAISIAILAIGVVIFSSWFRSRIPAGPTESAPIVIKAEPIPVPEPTVSEPLLPTLETEAPYRSERYRVGEIALGGEMALFVPEVDTSPLFIDSVRGEAFSGKGTAGSKLVISWETSKPARSELSYGKGVGQAEAVIREESYGTSHSVIIPDVSAASTYVYVIAANDKWGGTATSDPYAVYTGAREISLFELIAGAVGEVFGWAVDKE